MIIESALDQAAVERVNSFVLKVKRYKRETGATIRGLAEECEISNSSMHGFLNSRTVRGFPVTNSPMVIMLKISMALGIEI